MAAFELPSSAFFSERKKKCHQKMKVFQGVDLLREEPGAYAAA